MHTARHVRSGPAFLAVALIALAAATAAGAARAEQPAGGRLLPVIERISGPVLVTIMEAEGYAVSLDEDADVVWKIEGLRTLIQVDPDGDSLLFRAAFGDGNATLERVNAWNGTKRFSRSFLDDEGDPVLELDLDLTGGVTLERLTDYLLTCRMSYLRWFVEVVQ